MPERRIKASNEEYPQMNLIQTFLCWLRNPHVLFWPKDEEGNSTYDLQEPERKALISKLEDAQQEYIDLGVFSDYLNKKK